MTGNELFDAVIKEGNLPSNFPFIQGKFQSGCQKIIDDNPQAESKEDLIKIAKYVLNLLSKFPASEI